MQPSTCSSKKGRPANQIHECQTCRKNFPDASKKFNHQRYCKAPRGDGRSEKNDSEMMPPPRMMAPQMIGIDYSQFEVVKEEAVAQLGFCDNIVDGEVAHKSVKNKVEGMFAQYNNNVQAELPSVTTSQKKTSIGQISATTAIADQKQALQKTQQWNKARDIVQQQLFLQIAHVDFDFALSFFIQAAESQDKMRHIDFVHALATVISVTDLNKVPRFILDLFHSFFAQYQVQESHDTDDLHELYKLAQLIKADLEWLKEADQPQIVVIENDGPYHERFLQWIEVVRLFMEFRSLYSWDYISLMKTQLDSVAKYRMASLRTFLMILSRPEVTFDSSRLPVLLEKFLEIKGGNLVQIAEAAARLLSEFSLDMNVLLSYVEVGLKGSVEVLVKQLREGKEPMTIEQHLGYVKLAAEEQELRRAKLEAEEKVKQEVEERKRREVEQEQLRLRLLKEQKQKQEEEHSQQLNACFGQFISRNAFLQHTIEDVIAFEKDLQSIAGTIGKTLRAEQVVTMGLLLLSQKHTTLIQLATGVGKSLMLGILAQYLNQTTGRKVIVVVPTPFLQAYQQHHYCPTASKVPEKIAASEVKEIFYSDFDRFVAPQFVVPADTVLLVDEFHELFFGRQVHAVNGRVVSVVSKLLSSVQLVGVSATYRGDAGVDKITCILKDCVFIKPPQQIQERDIQLQVFGEVANIAESAVQLIVAKAKEMPVIVFCSDTANYKQLLPEAKVFDGNNVGDLMATLELLKASCNMIVLTTSNASKGVDFLFAVPRAFVIHTMFPSSIVSLRQDSGRGVRGSTELPIVGAVFTEKAYATLEGIEFGLSFQEQFDKLYPIDYLKSLEHLEKLVASTQPQLKALEAAVEALNQGKAFNDICVLLSKSTAFKRNLPAALEEFKKPLPVVRSQCLATMSVSLLGKRAAPERIQQEQQSATTCKHIEYKAVKTLMALACAVCAVKTKSILLCKGCRKYVCNLCHDAAVDEAFSHVLDNGVDSNEEEKDVAMMDNIQIEPEQSSQMIPGLLEDIRRKQLIEEAAALGLQVGEPAEAENSNSNNNNKRGLKQQEKEEVLSLKSGLSAVSKVSGISRSTNGRFEGSTQFGDNVFVKNGNVKGKQNWKCLSCKKQSVVPEQHVCTK